MASKLVFLGNITAIFLTLLAFLQIIPWSLIGLMILATLILPLLFSRQSNKSGTTRATSRKTTTPHQTTPDSKTHRQHVPERVLIHDHPALASSDPKPRLVQDLPKKVPAKAMPRKQNPPRPEPVRVETVPSQKPNTIRPVPAKPAQGGPLPENSTIIPNGDYEKCDVDLKEGNELVSEIKATGLVNVYLLDQDNLTSLDMGEEFWQEAGEESVQDTIIHFTASSTGKWFLVLENSDFKEVTATVNTRIA